MLHLSGLVQHHIMSVRVCGENCPAANLADSRKCYRCDSTIHLKCYGFTAKTVKIVDETPNFLLVCDLCIVAPIKWTDISKDIASVKSTIDDIKQIVTKDSKTSKSAFGDVKLTDNVTPVLTRSVKRRRFDGKITAATPAKKIVGTNNNSNALLSVEQTKAIVVSQLHPNTTEDNVKKFVRDNINVGDDVVINVKSLIPKDRSLNELSFISFKLVVPESLYSSILSADFWPTGVTVRDFIPGSSRRRPTGVSLNDNEDKNQE